MDLIGFSHNRVTLQAGGRCNLLEYTGSGNCRVGDLYLPEPALVELSAEVEEAGTPATDSTEAAYAEITWGNCHHRAQVDLGRGFALTVQTPVTVAVLYPPPHADLLAATTQPNIVVKASASSGGKAVPGIAGNAFRTLYVGASGQGALSRLVEIPPFAVACSVQTPLVANPVFELRFFGGNDAAAPVLSAVDTGKPDGATVPVPCGARFVAIFNPGLEVTTTRLRFYLGI